MYNNSLNKVWGQGGVIAQDDSKKARFSTESAHLTWGSALVPVYADFFQLAWLCWRERRIHGYHHHSASSAGFTIGIHSTQATDSGSIARQDSRFTAARPRALSTAHASVQA